MDTQSINTSLCTIKHHPELGLADWPQMGRGDKTAAYTQEQLAGLVQWARDRYPWAAPRY